MSAREKLGEAIYNALYAESGGRWECVETPQVWFCKADKIIAQHDYPLIDELCGALRQYRNDLMYPVAPDSRERRIAMIDNILSKVAAA